MVSVNWRVIFLTAAVLSVIAAVFIVGTQYRDIVSDSNPGFDSDTDRVDSTVNVSWIEIETQDWEIDPSDTSSSSVKLEQDGKGIIIREKVELNYNKSVYYNYSNWNSTVARYREEGFTVEEEPWVKKYKGRRFWMIKLSRTMRGQKAYVYFIATYESRSQYTFIYSYSPQYVEEGHLNKVLGLIASAELK